MVVVVQEELVAVLLPGPLLVVLVVLDYLHLSQALRHITQAVAAVVEQVKQPAVSAVEAEED